MRWTCRKTHLSHGKQVNKGIPHVALYAVRIYACKPSQFGNLVRYNTAIPAMA